MTTPRNKRRKVLSIPEEDFFEVVLLLMGPPKREYFEFEGPNRFEYGLRAWVKYAPEGQKFMALVESYGEAKVRAAYTYKRYSSWHHRSKTCRT